MWWEKVDATTLGNYEFLFGNNYFGLGGGSDIAPTLISFDDLFWLRKKFPVHFKTISLLERYALNFDIDYSNAVYLTTQERMDFMSEYKINLNWLKRMLLKHKKLEFWKEEDRNNDIVWVMRKIQ